MLLGLAGVLLIGLAAREAWLLGRAADPGLMVGSELAVVASDDRWPVEPGERVREIEGHALHDASDWMRSLRDLTPGPVELAVERGGEVRRLRATAAPRAPHHRLALWVRVVTGAALIVLGVVAFLLRPGTRATWLLLLMGWSLGAWMLGETVPETILPTLIVVMPLAVSAVVHFLWSFPQPPPWLARPRRAALIYAPPLVLVLMQVAARIDSGSWAGVGSGYARLHALRFAWVGVGILLGSAAIVHQYRAARRSEQPQLEAQSRGLVLAMVVGLVLPGVWSILRHLVGVGESPYAAYYNSVPMLFFVAMNAYLVVRHNALTIDRFTAAVAGYVSTAIVAAFGFAASLIGLPLLLGGGIENQSPAVLVGLTALIFLASAPAYLALKRRIDRRFFRAQADSTRLAETLRDLVYALRGGDLDEGLRTALACARLVQSERIELWQLDAEGTSLERRLVVGPERPAQPLPGASPLARSVLAAEAGGIEGLAPRLLPNDAQEVLWDLELAMAVPIHAHGAVVGFLGVERPRSGAGFGFEDLSVLTIIASQIGLALERDRSAPREVGRYRLAERLGSGGMADVHLAYQLGPGGIERKVALKRPLPAVAQEPAAIELFLDEARISAHLQHPNIAQVYEVGEQDGSYFLAMEYVDGPTLRALLRTLLERDEPLPPAVALGIFEGVIAALDHAHTRHDDAGRALGIVHRDVTPGNVIVSGAGIAKLVDFGIARAATQLHVTRAGLVRGTLAYMAPEQAMGGDIDLRIDVYAAATLLYEMLTGIKAFPQGPVLEPWRPPAAARPEHAPVPSRPRGKRAAAPRGSAAARQNVVDTRTSRPAPAIGREQAAPPPPPSSLVPSVSRALDAVFYRAVDFDRERRPPSALVLRDAVRAACVDLAPASTEDVAAWLRTLTVPPAGTRWRSGVAPSAR